MVITKIENEPRRKERENRHQNNMATKSIAEELYDKINEEAYKESVAPLSMDDKLPDHIFRELKTNNER